MKDGTKRLLKSFAINGLDLFVLSILTGIFVGAVVTFYNILVSAFFDKIYIFLIFSVNLQ